MEKRALRRAWLIMSFGNLPILENQPGFLDSRQADFYLLIDKKAGEVDEKRQRSIPRHSAFTFTRKFSYRDPSRVADALFEHFGEPEGGDNAP